jgi:2-succinyl-6-hydroxy-2,4-cyclohexadiene-1-carboxylate synthase
MKLAWKSLGTPVNPAILFLHGFLGDSGDWDAVALRLKDSYFCVSVDLPGHGGSEAPDSSPFCEFGNPQAGEASRGGQDSIWIQAMTQLLEMIEAPGWPTGAVGWKALVGYSMGGRLAMQLALSRPGLFRGLVLESASAGISDERERTRRLEADAGLAQELRTVPLRDFLEKWYRQPMFGQIPSLENLLDERSRQDPAGLAAAMEWLSVGRQPDFRGALSGAWKKPLLCLAGSLDPKYELGMKELASAVPGARFHLEVGSGHNVHRHAPEAFAARLSEFLRGY